MSLSFKDSLAKNNSAANKTILAVPMMVDDISVAVDPGIMTLDEVQGIMAYSGDDGNWNEHPSYAVYKIFDDSKMSIIDGDKNIRLDGSQFNITQEANSQYIPFEMNRRYDGFDLTQAVISIHYQTKGGKHGASKPVNVTYNDDKIRFGWLVDAGATADAGQLKFEIHAYGTVEGINTEGKKEARGYIWKSKSNDTLSVIQSLCDCEEVINQIDDSWVQELITDIAEQIALEVKDLSVGEQVAAAQQSAAAAQQSADEAKQSAASAKASVSEARKYVEDASNAAIEAVAVVLDTYAKKEYVDQAIESVDVTDQLENYATLSYVDIAIAGIDVTDQLENYVTTEHLTENYSTTESIAENYYSKTEADQKVTDTLVDYATKEDVNTAITEADISGKLNDYYKKTETYSQQEIDEKVSNVNVDLTGYATEKFVTDKTDPMAASISANTGNISSLSTIVTELQEVIGSVDTSAKLTYDIAYNDVEDPEIGENGFGFYEIKNEGQENEERTLKKKFTIVGGGGAATSSVLKIGYVTTSPLVVTVNDKAIIKYTFSGTDSSGDVVTEGEATWKVNGRIVAKNTAVAGENEFDVTEHLAIGTQKVSLSIVDEAGSLVTKTWNVQKIDVKIESAFNDKFVYPMGTVSFDYTPYGAISKDIHFVLDGTEIGVVTTTSSGIPMVYDLPAQTHGAHLLEVYITAKVNGNDIESNHIVKDIIGCDEDSDKPIIATTYQNFTAKQYDTTNIEYTVYHPDTENPTVEIRVNGELVSNPTLDKSTNIYSFKTDVVGKHTITITCGTTVKKIIANITKLDINVTPVTVGLVFDFNPSGKSNNDTDRIWTNGAISMSVSDNFDWVNGGYQHDENGDQYFCVKAGTTATINHNLFANDAKVNGKEFKVVFKTTNVKKRDTSFISCMNNNIGLDMKVESANIYSSNGSLYSPYCEEDIIEFEFNINKNTDIPMVLTYEDGVANRPMIYTADSSFWQATPQPITIGSADCDVHIYRMKAYSNSLSDSNILANFIADARNADEMVARYNRNQIYDENNLLDPEVLAKKCPDLRIIMIDAPWFTNDKDNKVDDTTIRMIYKNGDAVLDNWTCTGARHSGQGTSSNEYGYAGRNIDLIMDTDTSLFTLGDGSTSSTITLTRTSVPTDYLNVKVNIASSENQNNAQMARRYNDYNPFVRSAKFNDSKVKDTMEFYNCVIFVKERNEDIATHREFLDTNYHFYAIGNVGDSKKTDDSRVNDKNDPKECVIEITDYNVPLAEFPTGNPDGICAPEDWKAGNAAYDDLYAEYKYKDGKFKSFGNGSYEFRYEMKGITDEQRQVNIDAWRDAYRFIVTSTDEEFHRRLKEYFVVDSVLYFYLFTERYTLVDNRAKNSFWHYGKVYITSEEAVTLGDAAGGFIIDDEQAVINNGYRWDLSFFYDADTSLGIDNTGKLVLTYGKEDTDYYVDGDPSSAYIYRAAASTFFCRLRDLFTSEMQAMFVGRENANAWSANGLITQWDSAQSQFPEELWRLDIQRKYLRTYQGISIDNSIAGTANPRFLTEMLNGRKKYQRRMFERNQELYMATKYFGKVATQDQIMMRFNNPETYVVKPDFTLYLTPYSDMYIGVSFYNGHKANFRAKAGVKYTIPYPEGIDTADITLIYGASFIQAIDDLSKCYIGDNDFSKASRLQSLVIGSDVAGYANTYMKKMSLGNNKLLEYLDIRNVTGLDSVVDLSQCGNMLELYAQGSGATGVIFANGGKIEKAYIPAVVSLTMKNLNYLEDFSMESYNNLTTLIVENTPIMDTHEAVNTAPKLQILRLIGLDWTIETIDALNKALLLRGVNNDGGEIAQSVLTGTVHVPIVREQQLYGYQNAWPALEIIANTIIDQFAVTFINDDGTVLDVQYVDKGANAVDPVATGRIPTPTKTSSVSTDFTYAGWDVSLDAIFSNRTIKAVYSESTRRYTVKYVSKGITLQESTGLYGEYIEYTGTTPTYTKEEAGYRYHLFKDWDKSGYVDGNKIINAVFDEFAYSDGAFDGKELDDLSNVEIYALSKMGLDNTSMVIEDGDPFKITVGYDVDYDDIDADVIISQKTSFNGSNYVDTGLNLFGQDKDFVLALDYEYLSGNTANATLAQCFKPNGSIGFKLWFNNGTNLKLQWGDTVSSASPSAVNKREILVLRHKAGDDIIYVYKSNLDDTAIMTETLTTSKDSVTDATFVLGCAKENDGEYNSHSMMDVYWCKVWYKDLGDSVCKKLANWTHEQISFEMCGQKRFYLTEDSNKRTMISLLATHVLERTKAWGSTSYSNTGGWAQAALNSFLNTRLYNAMPLQIKSLLKQVTVPSSIGDGSSDISTSECYITIPAVVEVSSSYTSAPYVNEMAISSGKTISYMTSNTMRQRAFDGGDYTEYWLRSPNVSYNSYVHYVTNSGSINGYDYPRYNKGVLIEISF